MENLPPSALLPSPTNPRKRGNAAALAELEQSIERDGILQPLLVRPLPKEQQNGRQYEVVLGGRRHRCATRLDLPSVPVFVRDMTDEQVRIAQLAENLDRDDLHPLDEADSYKGLVDGGMPVEDVAAKLGRPVAYVRRRLSLCQLCEAARKAYDDGTLTLGAAQVLARLQDQEQQSKATKDVLDDHRGDEDPVTANEARATLRYNYHLKLAEAPFKTSDAELVPEAGACGKCPKRSGAQRDLFDAADGKDDQCLDAACFNKKRDAAFAKRAEEVKANGGSVASKAEAKKIFPNEYSHYMAGGYVNLADKCSDDPKRRTFANLLGSEHPRMLVEHNGDMFEVVPQKGLTKALKAAGYDFSKPKPKAGSAESKAGSAESKARDEDRARKAAAPRAVEAVLAKLKQRQLGPKLIADLAVLATRSPDAQGMLDAYELGQLKDRAAVDKGVRKLATPDHVAIVFAVLAETDGLQQPYRREQLRAFCKDNGVDLGKLEREELAKLKEAKPSAKKKGGKAKAKAKAKPAMKDKKKAPKKAPKKKAPKKAPKKKAPKKAPKKR